MQISPIQLTQHFFTKIAVDQRDKTLAEPTFKPYALDKVKMDVQLESGTAEDEKEEPKHFMIRLGITLDKERQHDIPYDISIELVGFFEVSDSMPAEKRAGLVLANGASILYSAARESILSMTSRFMKGHITMPTVNFIDDVMKLAEQNSNNKNGNATKEISEVEKKI
jgi:preprotein translocase subunit SecB